MMQGLVPRKPQTGPNADPAGRAYAALDAAGFTSVVATNSEHVYPRYLRIGDVLHGQPKLTDVSEEKQTGLGVGHFVTSVTDYFNQHDEYVGQLVFRILKFRPGSGRQAPGGGDAAERKQRPSPAISRDTQFFWDGLDAGELRIQKCSGCEQLHHPPMVRCTACGSYDFGYTVASGRGRLYSFVEPKHPAFPAFDKDYVVGLIELEEGVRIVSNVVDVDPAAIEIGMPLELVIRKSNSERPLPQFRPARPARNARTLRFAEVVEGATLASCPIPITTTLIVATAIASRDYQDVHHDKELAIMRGSPDIFMNILTSSGLCARFVGDWAGPEAIMKRLAIRLGVPNYPHDTMTMSGSVLSKQPSPGGQGGTVEVGLRGYNRLGNHVTGTLELELP